MNFSEHGYGKRGGHQVTNGANACNLSDDHLAMVLLINSFNQI